MKVETNMGLVGKVIADKVHGINQYGTITYDDLFQTGCMGLCKAVVTDKGGCFSTYAYRLIWNEICDMLISAGRLAKNETSMDCSMDFSSALVHPESDKMTSELESALFLAKKEASSCVRKGIDAIILKSYGYSGKEIGAWYGVSERLVGAWVSKARKYLKANRSFMCGI